VAGRDGGETDGAKRRLPEGHNVDEGTQKMNSALYVVKDVSASAGPRVNGRAVAHQKLDARQRACLGAQVLFGEKQLAPSVRQLAALFGVSAPYLMIALGLSPAKRAAIASGEDATSFAVLAERLKQPQPVKVAG
jgi:hypothetical protein